MGRHLLLYHVQDEPGEDPDVPNAAEIETSSGHDYMCLNDIYQQWPLPGLYHFRIRVSDDADGYLWQDIASATEPLPVWDGCVYAKVLRLDRPPRPRAKLRRKPNKRGSVGSARGSLGADSMGRTTSSDMGGAPSPVSSQPRGGGGQQERLRAPTNPSAPGRTAAARSRTPPVPSSAGISNNKRNVSEGDLV
eukprot:CAMPEP_0119494248 /NCGR_PEP_ID=MMETSP1344-20130328/18256_1 /TAXON_ID=236787 /ORGANISM="Florenciella parvula, Strain CCMP2471" /LENGTH=191 /DNA_ID=CAMNT_0007529735 /DNA_START=57 /DNA_END=629 /DNA_ORIENTATION=-